jgi:hypothetical protein
MPISYPTYRNNPNRANTRRKKPRKRRRLKRWVVVTLYALAVFIAGCFLYSPVVEYIAGFFAEPVVAKEPDVFEPLLYPYDVGTVRVDRYRDLNDIHVAFAKSVGIKGFSTDQELLDGVDALVKENKLVKIEDNDYYVLKELTHSHPYLTPNAAKLLEEIGTRFQKKLGEKGLDKCCFELSSLLRTNENQRRLSRSNSNASPNTSHLYGTTFDIAYNKVVKKPNATDKLEVVDGPAIKLLSETLGELRREGRCLVITERKEACFHITSTR